MWKCIGQELRREDLARCPCVDWAGCGRESSNAVGYALEHVLDSSLRGQTFFLSRHLLSFICCTRSTILRSELDFQLSGGPSATVLRLRCCPSPAVGHHLWVASKYQSTEGTGSFKVDGDATWCGLSTIAVSSCQSTRGEE